MKKLLPFLLLALAACGKPQVGDSCEANTGACESTTEALFCESSKLRSIDCNGPLGCSESTSGQVACDFSRARAGDSCPAANENTAQCYNGSPDQGLLCKGGVWTAQACKGCAVQNNQVVCQP
jgi:hypothetical protein